MKDSFGITAFFIEGNVCFTGFPSAMDQEYIRAHMISTAGRHSNIRV